MPSQKIKVIMIPRYHFKKRPRTAKAEVDEWSNFLPKHSDCYYAVYDNSAGTCALYKSTDSTEAGTDIIIWNDCRK